MGCASSAPLVEQGKNLVEGVKDAANDTMTKGEKAVHDTTDTIKDGVSTGIDTVKETVQSALNTAEESVGSVAHKIGETFSFSTSKAAENLTDNVQETTDHLSSAKDDVLATASETAAEAVSEAETVIVSETEHAREAFQSGTSPFFETVHSLDNELENTLKDLGAKGSDAVDFAHLTAEELGDSVHQQVDNTIKKGTEILEDLETDSKDLLGESVQKLEKTVEELHEEHREEAKIEEEESHRVNKEEPPPTFWEAAADAILMKKTLKNMEPTQFGHQERIFFRPPEKSDLDSSEKSLQENDIVVENADN